MTDEKAAFTARAKLPTSNRRIRLGIVGGGRGFIGPVHALAARMDNRFDLVAGALSSDPAVARETGRAWFLSEDRCYGSYRDMLSAEARRPDGIEAVAITTPNDTHFEIAMACLDAGLDIICDKPLTTTLADSLALVRRVRSTGLCFVVTHGFAAYPMVRQAQAMVRQGDLGPIRLVHVEYVMDWLSAPLEQTGDKQASWRTDPAISGPSGCVADIGTHAYHLARFISGLEVERLAAVLHTFVPRRRLDDNAHMLLKFKGGAQGTLIATQVAPGNECGLSIRLYGEKAGLEWHQEDPNYLRYSPLGESVRTLARGESFLSSEAQRMTRVPRGHPEGYLEAFSNVYAEAAVAIEARRSGFAPPPGLSFATVEDGAIGIAFVDAALESSHNGGSWVDPRPMLGD